MSDNPFATPNPGDALPGYSEKEFQNNSPPGALTAIAIICLVLGVFGLMGSCMGGASFGFLGAFETALESAPDDSPDMEIQRMNFAAQKKVMIPNLVLAGIGLIVATMMIIGSIGTLRKKEKGRKFLRTALLVAIVYSLFKVAMTIYSQMTTLSALKEGLENYEGPADPEAMAVIMQFTKIIGIVAIVVAAIFGLAFIVFYIWSRGYLNKSNVIEHFNSATDDTNKAY